MGLLFLAPSLAGLLIVAAWGWQLARHWDTPPRQLAVPPDSTLRPFPMTLRTWRLAILSGLVTGIAVAVVAYLLLP
jgi:hypothetical protein